MNPFSISDSGPRRKFKPAIPLGKIVPTPPGQACQPPAATPRHLPPLKVSTRAPHSYTRPSRSQPPYGAPVCPPAPPTPARAPVEVNHLTGRPCVHPRPPLLHAPRPPRPSASSQMPSSAAPRARQTPPLTASSASRRRNQSKLPKRPTSAERFRLGIAGHGGNKKGPPAR